VKSFPIVLPDIDYGLSSMAPQGRRYR